MTIPTSLQVARDLVEPALRAAVDRMPDDRMRDIARYQFGWIDADGAATSGFGGKALRPTLAVLGAEACAATVRDAVPGAVAVELVHNFSLLHDDIMDNDVERRHRPTAWVVFGTGPAILAGNAMLTTAVEVLLDSAAGAVAVSTLLAAVQQLIAGQSRDLDLEQGEQITLDDVLTMEAGKTASLLACSSAIGAVTANVHDARIEALAGFGHELGMAFQLVDDILGINGDTAVTGKSSSSDLRTGKRSAPIVAALTSGSEAGDALRRLLADGPPQTDDDVALAAKLVDEAGGLDWAAGEADRRLAAALAHLDGDLDGQARAQLAELARYVVARDR